MHKNRSVLLVEHLAFDSIGGAVAALPRLFDGFMSSTTSSSGGVGEEPGPSYLHSRGSTFSTMPRKLGWRMPPLSVHSVKRTLQTSSGRVKCASFSGEGSPAAGFRNGDSGCARSTS